MEAAGAAPFDYVTDWKSRLDKRGWWHSFELPDGSRIEGVCELEGLKQRIAQFPIPQNLSGKRVLDIGAWDGWFSFEMERRGAEVMAIDCWDNPRFRQMASILGSKAEYRVMDVYDLGVKSVGRFDIVLFLGVLYHLKHPLLALERVCAVTEELAAVDSFVLREEHRPGSGVESRPIMEFYETDEFGGQTDNWVGPSLPCLMAFCRTAGFARVELQGVLPHSACLACYRRWEEPLSEFVPPPRLLAAFHNTNYGINFASVRDEYLTCWFESDPAGIALQDVKPEVGPYGVRPIHVSHSDSGKWQAAFKLPPGLAAGWHEVRLRIGGSGRSNGLSIAVDVPVEASDLAITGVSDGKTWEKGRVCLSAGGRLAVWVVGLPENADRNNVRLYVGGCVVRVEYVEPESSKPARQVNAQLDRGMEPGRQMLSVALGERRAEAVPVEIVP